MKSDRTKDREDLIRLLNGMRIPVHKAGKHKSRPMLPWISPDMREEAIRAFDSTGFSAAVIVYSIVVTQSRQETRNNVPYFRGTMRKQRARQRSEIVAGHIDIEGPLI